MKIGMIGLGRMGMNMTKRLLQRHLDVIAYNRTPEKTEEVVKDGALPDPFFMIGCSRTEISDQGFRDKMREALSENNEIDMFRFDDAIEPSFHIAVCLFLEGRILGHFNPVLCREGGSGGLRPQSLCSILSRHGHQTFPNPPDPPSLPRFGPGYGSEGKGRPAMWAGKNRNIFMTARIII